MPQCGRELFLGDHAFYCLAEEGHASADHSYLLPTVVTRQCWEHVAVERDETTGLAYLRIHPNRSAQVARTERVSARVNADLTADGALIGIEFLQGDDAPQDPEDGE